MTARRPPKPRIPPSRAVVETSLAEAEETLDAIRSGAVDAIVVSGPRGEKFFTLEGAERSYRVLVEAMTEGAATLDEAGTILYCNQTFARMLGRPLSRTMGCSLRTFVATPHRPTFDALLLQGRKRDSRGEVTLTNTDGDEFPTFLSVNALRSDGDSNEKQVLCLVATDLTEQKRNEEMVASERLARSVLDQAAESIVVCDQDGRIVRASRATHRLIGGNPLLRDFDEVFPFELEGMSVSKAARQRKVIESCSVDFHRSDGTTFHLLVSAGPLLGRQKNVVGCVVTLTDCTDQKKIEKDLQNAVKARDEFMSIASHELRTPLTALTLQLQSMQMLLTKAVGNPLEERISHKLRQAVRQSGQLTKLIEGLLDVSRITNGKMIHVAEDLDLAAFTREVVDRCRAEADRAACKVEYQAVTEVRGKWDPMQLEQVLSNLIGNAIKYGPGKPIRVRVEAVDGLAVIKVKDQGIGIAKEDSQRIFERFERAVSPQHYGGLGLGLFIASRIVQSYGGNIAVDSRKGEGSEFTVSLPRRSA